MTAAEQESHRRPEPMSPGRPQQLHDEAGLASGFQTKLPVRLSDRQASRAKTCDSALTLESTPGSNLLDMSLKVSELAKKAGVSTDTIRYYEKDGLLPEPPRTHSGYRQYDEAAVDRLHFIRGAQMLGLKLADIKELLDIRDRGACPCGHTQRLLGRRVAEVDAEIRRLHLLRRELQSMERLECPSDSDSSPWPCEIEFVKRGGERFG
jgi:DNA-binding transcriptional MerR regulator